MKRIEKTFISFRFEVKGKIGRETKRKEKLLEVKQSEKTLISLRFEAKRKIIRRQKMIKLCFNFAVVGSKNLKRKEAKYLTRARKTNAKRIWFRFEALTFFCETGAP